MSEVFITRRIEATPQQLFEAFTHPPLFARWWTPPGYRCIACHIDPSRYGELQIQLLSIDGRAFFAAGRIKEIDPPERLSFTTTCFFAGEKDQRVKVLHDLILTAGEGETLLTLHFIVLQNTFATAGVDHCLHSLWLQRIEALEQLLPTERKTRTG